MLDEAHKHQPRHAQEDHRRLAEREQRVQVSAPPMPQPENHRTEASTGGARERRDGNERRGREGVEVRGVLRREARYDSGSGDARVVMLHLLCNTGNAKICGVFADQRGRPRLPCGGKMVLVARPRYPRARPEHLSHVVTCSSRHSSDKNSDVLFIRFLSLASFASNQPLQYLPV